MDLRFCTPVERKKFTCSKCPETIQAGRRCHDPGYNNLKNPLQAGANGLSYKFCPGKATWDPEIAELFEACRLTLETGIMPKGPLIDDQDAHFMAALPIFIDRWRERSYERVWGQVGEFAGHLLMSLFPKK